MAIFTPVRQPVKIQLLCGVALLLAACAGRSGLLATDKSPAAASVSAPSAAPRAVLLRYLLQREGSTVQVMLDTAQFTDAVIKTRPHESSSDLYRLVQLSAAGEALDSTTVADPMHRMVEYVEDDGSLQRKAVSLESGELLQRFNLNQEAQSIVLQHRHTPAAPWHTLHRYALP